MKAGIQISSFAPYMKDKAGLESTLSAMNRWGCSYTQLQWIDPSINAKHICTLLEKYSIKAIGVQDRAGYIFGNADYYIDLNIACGSNDICISGISDAIGFQEYLKRSAVIMNTAAEKGIMFSYHPTGKDLFSDCAACEALLETFPQLRLCADVCQLNDAGVDPVKFISAHSGRIDTVHFKDRDHMGFLSVVGEGKTDFLPIAEACADAGVKYVLAEQETSRTDIFDCLKRGFEYIENLLMTIGA